MASVAVGQQSCANPVSLIANEAPPSMDSSLTGFTAKNVVRVVVRSKMVDGRGSDAWGFEFVGGNNNNCVPDIAWSMQQANATCEDVWSAMYDWTVLRDECGFAYESIAGHQDVFTGVLRVSQTDALGTIRGVPQTRLSQKDLALIFRFDNEKTFTDFVTPQVYAPVLVMSAVTEAKWDRADQKLTMVIYNSVQYPFSLSVPYNASGEYMELGAGASIVYSNDQESNCPGEAPLACQRYATLELTPNEDTCVLDGFYTFQMVVSCSPSLAVGTECAIDPNNNKVNVTVYLDSGNLCGAVEVLTDESSLSLQLTTHADNTFSLPEKTGFFADQDIFVKAVLSSNRVSVADSTIREIIVDQRTLYSLNNGNNGVSDNGTVASFGLVNPDAPTGGINGFKFRPVGSLFAVAEDQKRGLPITVTIRAAYKASGLGKRSNNALQFANFIIRRQLNADGTLTETEKAANIAIDLSAAIATTNSNSNGSGSADDGDDEQNNLAQHSSASTVSAIFAIVIFAILF